MGTSWPSKAGNADAWLEAAFRRPSDEHVAHAHIRIPYGQAMQPCQALNDIAQIRCRGSLSQHTATVIPNMPHCRVHQIEHHVQHGLPLVARQEVIQKGHDIRVLGLAKSLVEPFAAALDGSC